MLLFVFLVTFTSIKFANSIVFLFGPDIEIYIIVFGVFNCLGFGYLFPLEEHARRRRFFEEQALRRRRLKVHARRRRLLKVHTLRRRLADSSKQSTWLPLAPGSARP